MRLSTRILFGEAEIRERVRAMAGAIAADTAEGGTLSVIALLDGAFMFCADLVRHLPVPVRLGLAPILSVGRGGNPALLALPQDFPVEGADLLVVEDILDTGRTLSALRSHLQGRRPARIRIAVLVDKPSGRQVPVRADYVGFTVGPAWVVGYGMDYEGLYRNLPYIAFVE